MSSVYSSTTVSGYNANPPPDDGTTGANNKITWAGIKSKLSDPINTYAAAQNTALTTAFGKTLDGAGTATTAVDYPAGASDQGRLIIVTASGKVVTTPDATTVLSPFVFGVVNRSNGTISLTGNNPGVQQTVDGSTSQSLGPGQGCLVQTDGTNWFSFGMPSRGTIVPQGRLTLTSGTPVLASDVTAATAVYYTPYVGNQIPIYDGNSTLLYTFSELTLTLASQHTASNIFDVFVFLNTGTVTIGTGPAWSNSAAAAGARGTGGGTTQLSRTNGLWTNTVQITARNGATTYTVGAGLGTYVGSLIMDGTNGQITCHASWGQSRKFGVWNAYNRQRIILEAGDSTASWNYTTNTIRQSRADSGNTLQVFAGLPEEWFDLSFYQKSQAGSQTTGTLVNIEWYTGIGYNSTTAFSGQTAGMQTQATGATTPVAQIQATSPARYLAPPTIGINNVNSLERSIVTTGASPFVNYFGGSDDMVLRALWMG